MHPRDARRAARAERRRLILETFETLRQKEPGLSLARAAETIGVSGTTLFRLRRRVETGQSLLPARPGRKRLPNRFQPDEEHQLQSIYLRTNRTSNGGSRITATRVFIQQAECRDELRNWLAKWLNRRQLPAAVSRIFDQITTNHFEQYRRPGMAKTVCASGRVGGFLPEMEERLRIIESDDGTLNFAAWIPWPQGGCECSDRYGVKLGRWQLLPMITTWSRYIEGYTIVARPKGSYREEDVRAGVHLLATTKGLPDAFRFERGVFEANRLVELLSSLGCELQTVHKPSSKPFIEGLFNKLWTYLSLLDGQVGRFGGDMEAENRTYHKCLKGKADPRHHFPGLAALLRGLDGAITEHNQSTISSPVYGQFVPAQRNAILGEQNPWLPCPEGMHYLFSEHVREWSVIKTHVFGTVPMCWEDGDRVFSAPFAFQSDKLMDWAGEKVRVYFSPTDSEVVATITSLRDFAGVRAGEIICQAPLCPDLPTFSRAASAWDDRAARKQVARRGDLMSALRRHVRMLDDRGALVAETSLTRDGRGGKVERRNEVNRSEHSQSVPCRARATSQPRSSRASLGQKAGVRSQEPEGEVFTEEIIDLRRPEDSESLLSKAFPEVEDLLGGGASFPEAGGRRQEPEVIEEVL